MSKEKNKARGDRSFPGHLDKEGVRPEISVSDKYGVRLKPEVAGDWSLAAVDSAGVKLGNITLTFGEEYDAVAEFNYRSGGDHNEVMKATGLVTHYVLNELGQGRISTRVDEDDVELIGVLKQLGYEESGADEDGKVGFVKKSDPNSEGKTRLVVNEVKQLGSYSTGVPKVKVYNRHYLPWGSSKMDLSGGDKYAERVFGVVMQVIETDTDYHQARVVESKKGLPTVVDIERKNWDVLANDRKGFHIRDLDPSEISYEREVYHYDDQGRLLGKTLFERSRIGLLGTEGLIPREVTTATYDDENRLRGVAVYGFTEDGKRYLNEARLWHYEEVKGNKVRVIESDYKVDFLSNTRQIMYRDGTRVSVIDPDSLETVAFASYDDERRLQRLRMSNRDFVKKHPVNILLRKKSTEPILEISRERHDRLESKSTDEVLVPTFITEEGYEAFVHGADFHEIGGTLSDPEQRQMFFQDFVEEVEVSNEDECVRLITDILLGKLKVPMFFPLAEQAGDEEAIMKVYVDLRSRCSRMTTLQKAAVASHFVPQMLPFIDGSNDPSDVFAHITLIIDRVIGLDRQDRRETIGNYMVENSETLSDAQIIALEAVRDLERFQDTIFQNVKIFERILIEED